MTQQDYQDVILFKRSPPLFTFEQLAQIVMWVEGDLHTPAKTYQQVKELVLEVYGITAHKNTIARSYRRAKGLPPRNKVNINERLNARLTKLAVDAILEKKGFTGIPVFNTQNLETMSDADLDKLILLQGNKLGTEFIEALADTKLDESVVSDSDDGDTDTKVVEPIKKVLSPFVRPNRTPEPPKPKEEFDPSKF